MRERIDIEIVLGRVVIANPKHVLVIADAKIKTNTIDAGYLPNFTRAAFCRKSGFQMDRARSLSRRANPD